MNHPPNQKSLPTNIFDINDENSILLGDLNAKHSTWGSVVDNRRGTELFDMMNDSAHLILNDGSPTHSSYSYNTMDALDVSIVCPEIYPLQ